MFWWQVIFGLTNPSAKTFRGHGLNVSDTPVLQVWPWAWLTRV